MITTEQYNEMQARFQAGTISEALWTGFCMKMLEQVLEANKGVMIRLKSR